MGDIVLKLSGITKRFGTVIANEDVGFELHQGEIAALLGENGAGKTTLMSVLFGHYVADEGVVEVMGRPLEPGSPSAALNAGVGMVHQHFTLAENMRVLDNIILGTESLFSLSSNRRKAAKKLDALMAQFGLKVDPQALVRDLSVGQQQRVEILKVLYRDAKILILDEPTAVLTPQESDALFATLDQLTAKGLSIIFITHKMREVMAVSHRCIVLRHGKIVFESRTRDTNPASLARAMVGKSLETMEACDACVFEHISRNFENKAVLSLEGICAKDGQGTGLHDLDLTLEAGQILGIAGVSGNGQAMLADIICGMVQPHAGTVHVASKPVRRISPKNMIRAGLGRVPDDRTGTGLITELSVMENLAAESYRHKPYSRWGVLRSKQMAARARERIETFDVRCPGTAAPVRNLSGGNMQKLILARELSGSPGIILANQPTWGLDVGATAYVHNQLAKAAQNGAGVVVISEDLDELLKISHKIQVMVQGRLSQPSNTNEVSREELGLAMAGHAGHDPGHNREQEQAHAR